MREMRILAAGVTLDNGGEASRTAPIIVLLGPVDVLFAPAPPALV